MRYLKLIVVSVSVSVAMGLLYALLVPLSMASSPQRLLVPENPTVQPAGNSHAVPSNVTVSITYDEPVVPNSVSTRTLLIYAAQTGLLTNTVAVTGGTIRLVPSQPFRPGEIVQVTATTDTLGINGQAPISPTVWQFRVAAAAGPGLFIDSGQRVGNADSRGAPLGDLDGDGDLDAYVANCCQDEPDKVWFNDGAGNFSDSGQNIGGWSSLTVQLGDLDNDGDLDAYVGTSNASSGGGARVVLNDGHGNFSDSGQRLGERALWAVALGDLDGDGDLDAVGGYTDYADTANEVWLNNGSGNFSNSGQALGNWGSFDVALGDLDEDGDLDLFAANVWWDVNNKIWLNDGSGRFTDSGQSLPGSDNVALGDLDSDGDLDAFLSVGNAEPNRVLLNDGTGIFSETGQNLGTSGGKVALGDIDGDGDLDAYGIRYGEQLWLNNGDANFVNDGQILEESYSLSIDLGDLDGDGDLDALTANAFDLDGFRDGDESNKIWLNSSATTDLDEIEEPSKLIFENSVYIPIMAP